MPSTVFVRIIVSLFGCSAQASTAWIKHTGKSCQGYANGDSTKRTLEASKAACLTNSGCKGIECPTGTTSSCTLRAKTGFVDWSPEDCYELKALGLGDRVSVHGKEGEGTITRKYPNAAVVGVKLDKDSTTILVKVGEVTLISKANFAIGQVVQWKPTSTHYGWEAGKVTSTSPLMIDGAEPFAIRAFKVGEVVECRDGNENWEPGKVTQLSPLKVQKTGWAMAFTWDEVRKATCFENNKKYTPLDMSGQVRTVNSSAATCQQRCASVPECAHFSWWGDGGCHLQDASSSVQAATGATAGPPDCQAWGSGGRRLSAADAGLTVVV